MWQIIVNKAKIQSKNYFEILFANDKHWNVKLLKGNKKPLISR